MKLAHITTVDMSLRYLLLNQLRDLEKTGYEVVGISAPGCHVSAIESAGMRHIAVPMTRRAFTPVADLRALWCLYRVIRREAFMIVHTHTPKAGILGRWAARAAGVPVIVHTSHGFIFDDRSPSVWRLFFRMLEKMAARCSDLVFSVNHEDIEIAVRECIGRAEKLMPLGKGGMGIDAGLFDPDRFSPDVIASKRVEVGLPGGAKVVGFVGRLVREKGLLELFAAARIVRQRVPDVRFVFIGPVDMLKADVLTPGTAQEYGIADICRFLGMRQDMPELYALMDVFVLPSHREGFPRAAMEASAMKVPCVVTDVRGCREAVREGRNGLLVALGDIEGLADAIIELLTNREKARRMGEEARLIALECFDERVVFEKVKGEYARLLHERGLSVPDHRP